MPRLAIIFGLLLSALSAVAYLQPELLGSVPVPKEGEPPPSRITALIPALFGVALILCGFIGSASPDMRKHAMHVAAVVSLLGIVGALFRPISLAAKGQELNFAAAPLRATIIMAILSLIFLILCVRSFVQARILRKSSAVTSTTPSP
jgi:hypothetical protein